MTSEMKPCIICLGFFDGVHLGHRALLDAAKAEKNRTGFVVVVHTFDRSPAEVITGKTPFQLTDRKRKEQLLIEYGADEVIFAPFTEEIMVMPGKDYFQNELLGKYDCRCIICGDDHRFGHKGDTGSSELKTLCEENNVKLILIPPVYDDRGCRISSTAIRKALMNGLKAEAEKMLGRQLLNGNTV